MAELVLREGPLTGTRVAVLIESDYFEPEIHFYQRPFAEPDVLKGIICHGFWLLSTIPETIRGRKVVCHNNLVGDVRNMGAEYVDADVVVDGHDLVTGRTGQHAHLFARQIIDILTDRRRSA